MHATTIYQVIIERKRSGRFEKLYESFFLEFPVVGEISAAVFSENEATLLELGTLGDDKPVLADCLHHKASKFAAVLELLGRCLKPLDLGTTSISCAGIELGRLTIRTCDAWQRRRMAA